MTDKGGERYNKGGISVVELDPVKVGGLLGQVGSGSDLFDFKKMPSIRNCTLINSKTLGC
jgi:hypothetical protein